MKKMTVTELNTLTDYVVESVLNQKREEALKRCTSISQEALEVLFDKATELCAEKNRAEAALKTAKEKLSQFYSDCRHQNHMGKFVNIDTYYGEAKIAKMNDEEVFDGTNLEPWSLKRDIQRKLVLKNLGSELDVEAFIEELVKSY